MDSVMLSMLQAMGKNKYYTTFLCYNNESFSYQDDPMDEISPDNISQFENFTYKTNGQAYSYDWEDGIFYVSKQEQNVADEECKVFEKHQYDRCECDSVAYGKADKGWFFGTQNYPKEWGYFMFNQYNGCVLSLKNKSCNVKLYDDKIIDSLAVIKILNEVKQCKRELVQTEQNIIKAESGNLKVGSIFPPYILKDIKNDTINSSQPSKGAKILIFWSDFLKRYEDVRQGDILLKEFNELAGDSILVISCFAQPEGRLNKYVPNYKELKKIKYVTSTMDWQSKYLGINYMITVVITDASNKILYNEHYFNNKGEINVLKEFILSCLSKMK